MSRVSAAERGKRRHNLKWTVHARQPYIHRARPERNKKKASRLTWTVPVARAHATSSITSPPDHPTTTMRLQSSVGRRSGEVAWAVLFTGKNRTPVSVPVFALAPVVSLNQGPAVGGGGGGGGGDETDGGGGGLAKQELGVRSYTRSPAVRHRARRTTD